MIRSSRGFTLIELLFTVSLIAIMIAIAVPSFVSFMSSYRATGAVNDLLESINLTRTEALKRGRRVTLSPIGGDWRNGWTVYADNNSTSAATPSYDGVSSPADELIFQHIALAPQISVAAPASSTGIFGGLNYIAYDGTGYTRATTGAASVTISGGIAFTDTSGSSVNVRTLCIATFGRPRIINTQPPTAAPACS
jgi:type IV fimbrial biogenesis protein FimT